MWTWWCGEGEVIYQEDERRGKVVYVTLEKRTDSEPQRLHRGVEKGTRGRMPRELSVRERGSEEPSPTEIAQSRWLLRAGRNPNSIWKRLKRTKSPTSFPKLRLGVARTGARRRVLLVCSLWVHRCREGNSLGERIWPLQRIGRVSESRWRSSRKTQEGLEECGQRSTVSSLDDRDDIVVEVPYEVERTGAAARTTQDPEPVWLELSSSPFAKETPKLEDAATRRVRRQGLDVDAGDDSSWATRELEWRSTVDVVVLGVGRFRLARRGRWSSLTRRMGDGTAASSFVPLCLLDTNSLPNVLGSCVARYFRTMPTSRLWKRWWVWRRIRMAEAAAKSAAGVHRICGSFSKAITLLPRNTSTGSQRRVRRRFKEDGPTAERDKCVGIAQESPDKSAPLESFDSEGDFAWGSAAGGTCAFGERECRRVYGGSCENPYAQRVGFCRVRTCFWRWCRKEKNEVRCESVILEEILWGQRESLPFLGLPRPQSSPSERIGTKGQRFFSVVVYAIAAIAENAASERRRGLEESV
ncbi:hypothetical protein B0H13DRAFT_2269400 [Mycena leptocephala]|nr:hypothetical protein B0H13DRAFT_2269400 [Mycena leptocephala]